MSLEKLYQELSKEHPCIQSLSEELVIIIAKKARNLISGYQIDKLTWFPNSGELASFISKSNEKISLIWIKLIFLNTYNHHSIEKWNEHILQVAKVLQTIAGIKQIYKISGSKFWLLLESEDDIPRVVEALQTWEIEMDDIYGVTSKQKLPIQIAVIPRQNEWVITKMEKILNSWERIWYYKEVTDNEWWEYQKMNYFMKLQSAIKHKRIIPFYQPILCVKTRKVVKYESLFRVKNEKWEFDMKNYYHFLQAADEFKINGIAEQMIDKVFKKLTTTKDKQFSINLSGNDLRNDYLIRFIIEKLQQYQIQSPSRITFEILESAWEEDKIEQNIDFIRILKSFWFQVSMDDFWVWNGSLNVLNRLISERLINYIKIDRALIQKAMHQKTAISDIQHLVAKAHHFESK